MERKPSVLKLIWMLFAVTALASCSFDLGGKSGFDFSLDPGSPILSDYITGDEDKVCDFTKQKNSGFYFANGYKNGDPFNCYWSENAGKITSTLALSLYREGDTYYGAEYRSWGTYSSGYFSTSMKAAKCSGVVTSFFTYTGYPWDEIDIEFLGKNTNEVQFNYYHNGVGGHEYIYRLGYDGSESFHEYGFYWDKTQIIWFVDSKPVYRATKDIPQKDMNIMCNVWNGKGDVFDGWAGKLDESKLPVKGEYEWIGYSNKIIQ